MERSPLREFLRWIADRTDIKIMTVHIEYFKDDESNPIVFKFGHKDALEPK